MAPSNPHIEKAERYGAKTTTLFPSSSLQLKAFM